MGTESFIYTLGGKMVKIIFLLGIFCFGFPKFSHCGDLVFVLAFVRRTLSLRTCPVSPVEPQQANRSSSVLSDTPNFPQPRALGTILPSLGHGKQTADLA